MVKINKKIPAFSGNATGGIEIQSKNLQGKTVVIYFYPKDNTPGCTQQGQDFRDNYTSFQHQQTIILGVSRDNLSSHEKFKEKQNFHSK